MNCNACLWTPDITLDLLVLFVLVVSHSLRYADLSVYWWSWWLWCVFNEGISLFSRSGLIRKSQFSVCRVSFQSVVGGRNHRNRKAQTLLREAVQTETEGELRELQKDLQHGDGTQALLRLQDKPTRPMAGVLNGTDYRWTPLTYRLHSRKKRCIGLQCGIYRQSTAADAFHWTIKHLCEMKVVCVFVWGDICEKLRD